MLLGRLAALAVQPGSPLYHAGDEVVCVAGSIEQGKLLAKAANDALPDGYLRWTGLAGGGHRVVGVHKETGSSIRVISGSGKAGNGAGRAEQAPARDEPGSWERRAGSLMYEALRGALGKVARWPAAPDRHQVASNARDWWPRLIEDGSGPGCHVTVLDAPEDEPWDDYQVIAAANPVIRVSGSLRRTVLRERAEARLHVWRQPAFEAWRLNRLRQPEQEMLLSVADWRRVTERPCPPREGRPVCGIDLGASRSWTGVVAAWANGRVEAFAVVAGLPSLTDREKADGAPRGSYSALADSGALVIDEGLRVTTPATAISEIGRRGWGPVVIVSDTFKVPALRDASKIPLNPGANVGQRQGKTSARSVVWRWTVISPCIRTPSTSCPCPLHPPGSNGTPLRTFDCPGIRPGIVAVTILRQRWCWRLASTNAGHARPKRALRSVIV